MNHSHKISKHFFIEPITDIILDPPKAIQDRSLLSSFNFFRSQAILAEGSADLNLSPEIGNIFQQAGSTPGDYSIELAIELPDTFSPHDDHGDWCLPITLDSGQSISCCFSNQLCTFNCVINKTPHVMLTRLSHVEHLRKRTDFVSKTSPKNCHTVINAISTFKCNSAKDAINQHLPDLRDQLIEAAAKFSIAHLANNDKPHRNTHPIYSRNNFEIAYLQVSKIETDSTSLIQSNALYWIYPMRNTLSPTKLTDEAKTEVENYLADPSPSTNTDHLLRLSEACNASGIADLAFLLAFFYCESEISRAIQSQCLKMGVSKGKYEESKRNITMSFKSNVLLQILFENKLDPKVIRQIDLARKNRNAFVHEGVFNLTSDDVRLFINACKDIRQWSVSANPVDPPDAALSRLNP